MEPTKWPPGWHPDPTARFEFRYYNGQRWTSDVSVNGQRFVDSLESAQPSGEAHPGWAASSATERRPSRAYAIASFWVAFGSLLCAWIPFIFAVAIGGAVTAFIFALAALRRERKQPAGGHGYAVAGLVLSIAALGLSSVGFVLTRSVMREVNDFLEAGPNSATIDSCVTTDGVTVLDGSITNGDTRTRSYTVRVNYVANELVEDSDAISVRSVAPGATETFHATSFPKTSPIECRIDSVTGPNPFDVQR